jgi:hypothetical protein
MTINPGRSATLQVEFTMHQGMDGPHDFRIPLMTNDPTQSVAELGVKTNWIP